MKFFFKRSKSKGSVDPENIHQISDEYLPGLVEKRVREKPCNSIVATLLRKEMGESETWYSNQRSSASVDPGENRFSSQSIMVEIGGLLRRVPRELLIEGAEAIKGDVPFKAGDLIGLIAKQKPFMKVSFIAKTCPELFREEITPANDLEIMFPWHSVAAQLEACWGRG